MCDYDTYNAGGTDANYHQLPIFTKTKEECQAYFDSKTIDGRDYSQLKSRDGSRVLGYICLPWCSTSSGICSSDKLKLNGDNTWSVNGRKTDYGRHINKYQPEGSWPSPSNACVLLDDEARSCVKLDSVCCGAGFAGAQGTYCDRLSQNQLFLTACHTEGSKSECCDHGTCESGICACDPGYAGNCCECADGYRKDASGNCVKDEVYCCDETTFQVKKVPAALCAGPGSKVVPDDSPGNCWPQGKSWCSADKQNCVDITMPVAWGEVRGRPGNLMSSCQGCLPEGLYYCNKKDDCAPPPAASLRSAAGTGEEPPKDVGLYFLGSALAVLILCFIIFIIRRLNKKKE